MFSARAEERIYLAPLRRSGEARRRAVSVAIAIALYALFGAAVVFERESSGAPTQETEIPVEIVVEPPPPPPPPLPPAPEPPKLPDVDLTPAQDAPRAGTADADTGDKEKPSPPPPAPAADDKTAERASGAEADAETPKPEAQATPQPEPSPGPSPPPLKLSEGEIPVPAPQPSSEAASPANPALAAGKAAPKSAPLFASVPDVDFGAAMKAPVSGGNARANYLSILFGVILPHFHKPHGGRSALGRKYGALVFSVDGQGRLINRYVVEESGLPELDRAAIDAVGASSPFPPPPPSLANGSFRWSYGVE